MSSVVAHRPAHKYTSLRAAWVPLFALCLAFFVEMVDNTLLTIALPTIGRDLGGSTTALQWVTGAYSLTFGSLLLTAGSAADRLGRRRVLLVGLAAVRPDQSARHRGQLHGQLIALRAALGVAAAMMAPITNSLVFRLFDDDALRMRAITVMIVVGMSGFVLGPLIGGTALAHVRWEWLLVVNAPIALIAFIGVRLGVAADDPAGLTERQARPARRTAQLRDHRSGLLHRHQRRRPRLDVSDHLGIGLGAAAALTAFVWHERRTAEPMLDLACSATAPSGAPRSRRPVRRSRWPL